MKTPALLSSFLVVAGCVGSVADMDGTDDPAPGGTSPRPMGSGGSGGAGSTPTPQAGSSGTNPGTTPTSTPTAMACPAGKAVDPGPALMRRLTNAEYRATVKDLLGVDVSANVVTFPADFESGGFDNAAGTQTISALHADRYMVTGQEVANQLVATAAARNKAMGCDVTMGDPKVCLRAFVEKFGRKAFRRPMAAAEVDRLLALAATETDVNQGISLMVQAVLQSPKFLFRPEVGAADVSKPGVLKLTGYEVATRLSFFLVGTTPDDGLLDAAGKGELDTVAGVEAVTKRLLADPRMKPSMKHFTDQWFHLEKLGEAMRDTKQFPLFSATLTKVMGDEAARLLEDAMWGPNANFLDLYTANHGYVDSRLAQLYKVPAPMGASSSALSKVTMDGVDRGGFLSSAAFLTLSSLRGNETSPISRGKHIRESVLCDRLPPPPAEAINAAMMAKAEAGESRADMEDRLTMKGPAQCMGCHRFVNPIGYGLERYDSIGGVRQTYSTGKPVRNSGDVTGMPDDPNASFSGAVELGKLVRSSPKGAGCAIVKTFRWALGREEDGADECTLAQLGDSFRGTSYSYPQMLTALARSDAFRYRRPHAR